MNDYLLITSDNHLSFRRVRSSNEKGKGRIERSETTISAGDYCPMSYRACTQSADKARSQKMERYFCKFDLMKDQQSMLICGQSNPQHHVYWHQIFHRQSSQTSQPRTKISRQLKHQTVENISTYDKKLAYFGIFIKKSQFSTVISSNGIPFSLHCFRVVW